jgi:hypothetical protein
VKGAQGGEGHYSVADPVGGAHQNLAIGHSFTSVVSGRRLKPSLRAEGHATTLLLILCGSHFCLVWRRAHRRSA